MRLRGAAITLLAVAAGVAAVIGVIAFFGSRDEGSTAQRPTAGAADPRAAGALLRAGNVELVYGAPGDAARVAALVERLGAGDSPALRAAGQAVIVRRESGRSGVLARAWRHSLRARGPSDPRLQDFVETWLGAAASG